jgi:small multidrug resistance family-3 protein
MAILKSLFIFFIAGICEIGGGYLIWLSIKEEKPIRYGILGGVILIGYGIVATFQIANFARTCATYGGVCIICYAPRN